MAYSRSAILIRLAHAYEEVTVAATVATLNASRAEHADRAFVTAEGGSMRFRYDGGNPSTSVGHILVPGDTVVVEGTQNIKNFKAIRKGTVTNGILRVTYEV